MESAGVDEMGKTAEASLYCGTFFVPPCAQGADGTSEKGFSIPIQKWLKEPELYAWAESLLKEDKIRQGRLFLTRNGDAAVEGFYTAWNLA